MVNPHHNHEGLGAHTRERLLDVAEELFSSTGFERTSVRDITAAASCNLAAVNYHFGSKRGLYREAFRRCLAVLRQQRIEALEATRRVDGGSTLAQTLQVFAEAFIAPFREEQEGRSPLKLIMREMADPQLPREVFRSELVIPVNRALGEAVAAAAPELPGSTVRLCVQSFVAQLLHAVHAQRFAATGADEDVPFTLHELVAHIVRFTVTGIRHIQEEPE